MEKIKKIHFIGICGVAMSALALAFKKKDWKVTGSDAGFFPPVSTNLEKNNIDFYPGWHPDRVLRSFSEGERDGNLIVVGNVASSTNPEWIYVQEKNLNYKSYPEVIAEYFIKENSIVIAGTFSKSTNAALMSWILKQVDYNPSYMFGGVSTDDMPTAEISDGDWSVVEGDEYKTSRWDAQAKFFHYSPTHLLLTGAIWDHADIYPTAEEYEKVFIDLVNLVPKNGLVVANTGEDTIKNILNKTNRDVISFGVAGEEDYSCINIELTKDGTNFDVVHKKSGEIFHLQTKMLGDYIAKNFTGCFAMAHEIGIEPKVIIEAIRSFDGIKRRLEKRFDGHVKLPDGRHAARDVTVYDDISHSPEKSRAVLASLRKIYNGKIIAIFEPNTGNRKSESFPGYDNCFVDADEIIIPRLTKVKIDPNDPSKPVDGEKLADIIKKTQPNVSYIDDDAKLIEHILKKVKRQGEIPHQAKGSGAGNNVVVFLGSHGFRGMITQLVSRISTKQNKLN